MRNMNIEKQPRRIAKIGIKDFEPFKEVEHVQQDMLERFEHSSLDPGRYCGLADCRADYCAYKRCMEACWYGTGRRRIKEVFDLTALSRIPIEGQQKGAKESLFAKFPVMLKIQGVPFKTVPR
jgi:hypothetical protein